MIEGEDLLLCPTCGTQFDTPASDPLSGYCRICDVSNLRSLTVHIAKANQRIHASTFLSVVKLGRV